MRRRRVGVGIDDDVGVGIDDDIVSMTRDCPVESPATLHRPKGGRQCRCVQQLGGERGFGDPHEDSRPPVATTATMATMATMAALPIPGLADEEHAADRDSFEPEF